MTTDTVAESIATPNQADTGYGLRGAVIRCRDCGCEDVEAVEFGPELPDLIYASDGTVWGQHGRGALWWYGSTKAVLWSTLVRMRDGVGPSPSQVAGDHLTNQFPWGPWEGANYGADHQAILERLGAVAA
jgi:hypothetical protein